MESNSRIDVYLVCNAKYHDTNFARLELLKLLAEHEDVVVRVSENYSDSAAILSSVLLITYTCDLCPNEQELNTLQKFLNNGGRWFALHGTSAMLEFVGDPIETDNVTIPGKGHTPRKAPALCHMLGNHFVSHPPVQRIRVTASDTEHPLVRGIAPVEVFDAPYYCEFEGQIHTLLESRYTANAEGYVIEEPKDDAVRPQLYLHPYGSGEVLYCTRGHCRGKYDMQPLMPVCSIERCSWESPIYYEILRRALLWGPHRLDD